VENRPENEVFVVPGGNFPTMPFISDWERAVGKPVITTNQAMLWAMVQMMQADEKLAGFGRLLAEMPAIWRRVSPTRSQHSRSYSLILHGEFAPASPLRIMFRRVPLAIHR